MAKIVLKRAQNHITRDIDTIIPLDPEVKGDYTPFTGWQQYPESGVVHGMEIYYGKIRDLAEKSGDSNVIQLLLLAQSNPRLFCWLEVLD